jgi:hypothetical protein
MFWRPPLPEYRLDVDVFCLVRSHWVFGKLDSSLIVFIEAAAARPDGYALAGPSALTSISTRWARVTMKPCHALHGRGLNEVPIAAIRVINNCREAMYGGFWSIRISALQH